MPKSDEAPPTSPTRRRSRVLLVEDEALLALNLEDMLIHLGYEVCGPAASAREAIDAAGRLRPDLVLMDVNLRGSANGIIAAATIREQHGIPSVFLTAHGDPATRKRAEAARPVGYIVKPVSPAELAAALQAALSPTAGS